MSLLPHAKLDWNLARLERHLDEHADDAVARLEYATALWSKAAFHGGGEPFHNKALTQARRVLQHDSGNAGAQVVAAAALVGLDRLEAAQQHLDQAMRLDAERADLRYARGLWHQAARRLGDAAGDRHQAVREIETACRLAPDAWEPHALLATLLWERAQELGGPARASRMVERSQYHAVRALALDPAGDQGQALLYHLGILCLHGGKFAEANKLFTRLLDVESYRVRSQYYLGLVNYQLGKYKNAVLYLRQHLDHAADSAKVQAKIGMAYLQLGEVAKAREACNRALALDPGDLQARFTLACALVEEDREDDAIRTLKGILDDAPEHQAAFAELVRMRARRGDAGWLRTALRAETNGFDQLPPGPPRDTTRERIAAVLASLRASDDDAAATAILEAVDLTSDESLRFLLWEQALDHLSTRRAKALGKWLEEPGRHYSAKAGREALVLARSLPEPLLVRGLQIEDEDLRRAAVDRHGPGRDVNDHRKHVDHERREARAWQALLLLAIASHGNRSTRTLLVRWASEADPDLADAANAALAMLGDADATDALRKRARGRGVGNLVDALVAQVQAPETRQPVRPLAAGEDRACTTCGRRGAEVAHMMVGAHAAICNHCLADVAAHRRALETDDPEKVCALSGRGTFETAAMYVYRGFPVSREVVDHGLGLLEREAVDRWLATL